MEGFGKNGSEQQKPSSYFEGANSSKEFLAAKRFVENYLKTEKLTLDLTDTPENVAAVKKEIERLGNRLMPGIVPDVVIDELRKGGVFKKYVPEAPKPKEPEFVETKYVKLEGPKEVEIDEDQQQILEANLLMEEVEKENVFTNPEELNTIHTKSMELQEGGLESDSYYLEFTDLVEGGEQEIKRDIELLHRTERQFRENKTEDSKEKEKIEQASKIATITERALAHVVTNLEWYGKDMGIRPVSKFDDVYKGVDNILEVGKKYDGSTFLGVGIDVTYRGLYSEQFKQKFFKLLHGIQRGEITTVKYYKNRWGDKMREFAIPKMVLYFNPSDVKQLVEIVRHADDPDAKEQFKDSPQKANILMQILSTCAILEQFAEESRNSIFRKYNAVQNSIKVTAWKHQDIQKIIEQSKADNEVTKHMKGLVKEFRLLEQQQAA